MERLLLIFIVIGNVLPFLHALPHQKENLEKFDESKENYNEIVSLVEELENSADVTKKSGRTIHQTAWSKENNEDENNSIPEKAVQENSTRNIGSWDLSHLLKLLLNLVHNGEEDKTEETVKSIKDINGSKSKAHSSDKLYKLLADSLKHGSIAQEKYSKSQKNDEEELVSNNETNSYYDNSLDNSYEQKKQKSGMATKSLKNRNAEKNTQSNSIDRYSSLNNIEFSKIEQLFNDLNEEESEKEQSLDENYYYDDDYYEDGSYDEYCDSYSSSFSSENASISENTKEDSYEAEIIEVSDKDYLKLTSENTEELVTEIPAENDSQSSESINETTMQDDVDNQETNDATTQTNKVSIKNIKVTKNEIKEYPTQDITNIQMQTEDIKYNNTELDIISSSGNNEINILDIESSYPEQNSTLTTKDDKIVLEKPEFQNNYNHVTRTYRPLIGSTVKQEVEDQNLISQVKDVQSTTPLIAGAVNFPAKNTEFQSQIDDQLAQETILQKTSSDTESTQKDILVSTTSDTIQIRKPVNVNSTFQTKNYSISNQETTQEVLQSLPLSSSGEFISNTFENDQQLSMASKTYRQLPNTSEKDRQISYISESNQQLSNTFDKNGQLATTSETDTQLSNTSDKDRHSYITINEQELSNAFEKTQNLSGTSQSDQQISNMSENDKQLILFETDSKNTILENSKLQKDFQENGLVINESESSNLSYRFTKDQEEVSNPLRNAIVLENEKTQLNYDNGAKYQMPDKSQIINKLSFQGDELQKSKSPVIIIINNGADENLNVSQSSESLQVDEISNQILDMPVTPDKTLTVVEESENDDEYYEFDVKTSSVNFVSTNDQNSLRLAKTTPIITESDQNNINLANESEKSYDTILQFLYKHSNSSLVQSLKEYE